jgi:integrase
MSADGESVAMPPDDMAILPEPPTSGADKFSAHGPAAAAPEDVRHWFDLETIVELPAPLGSFDDAAEAAAQYRRASRSENTRRAYRAAVARFCDWCAAHGRTALPASPETVAAFLAAEARRNLAVNTLRLRHAAIRYLHLLAGYPPPTAAAVVSTTFAGIKRAHRRPVNKKTALVLDRLRAAIQTIPATLPGVRDRALLLVGFAAALRPSEIAGLTLDQVARHADGIELFLPWRKNDQDARGTRLWLPVGRTELCPVRALDAWLDAAAITEGPLFRRIWRLPPPRVAKGARPKPAPARNGGGADPIDTDSIALIVKHWTGLAGFDGAAFAGHSLRRGAISSGVAAGVHIARLKQFSGHASLKSLEEYVELDELRHNHPLKDIL